MTDKRVVLSTAGTKDEAQKIALMLVERKHAACVNISGPMESVYRWQGKVEDAQEWLLIIKTTVEQFVRVKETIREVHSYDLPEIIEIAIESGSHEYLEWIAESVRQ
jgi:periplasmic divalent cation tolerance protein